MQSPCRRVLGQPSQIIHTGLIKPADSLQIAGEFGIKRLSGLCASPYMQIRMSIGINYSAGLGVHTSRKFREGRSGSTRIRRVDVESGIIVAVGCSSMITQQSDGPGLCMSVIFFTL